MKTRAPWLARWVLWRPEQVEKRLAEAERVGLVARAPNPWQVTLGILRMWHRVIFRSDTIGLSGDEPVRSTWRARWLQFRPLRFPFLLAERAVTPWDFSGLLSSTDRVTRHLLGAHHEGKQFAYDLQLLRCHPGALERVRDEAEAVVSGESARAEWLRDLVVFERYHETLLEAVERALSGDDGLDDAERIDPDVSFSGYLAWCAAQPETPAACWSAWRAGHFTLSSSEISAS